MEMFSKSKHKRKFKNMVINLGDISIQVDEYYLMESFDKKRFDDRTLGNPNLENGEGKCWGNIIRNEISSQFSKPLHKDRKESFISE